MHKKIIPFLIVCSMVLCSCGKKADSSGSVVSQTSGSQIPSTVISYTDQSSNVVDTDDPTPTETVSIEPGVLYEDDNVRVTSESIDSDSSATYLFATFENLTDKKIALTSENAYVNSFYVDSSMLITIDANSSASFGISFNNADLNVCQIKEIEEITFQLNAFDPDTYADYFTTDWITAKTSAYKTGKTTLDSTGTKLYEKDNVDVSILGYTSIEADSIPLPMLLVTNNSDKTIYIDAANPDLLAATDENGEVTNAENLSGYAPNFSYELPAGKSVIGPVTLTDMSAYATETSSSFVDDDELYEQYKSEFDAAAEASVTEENTDGEVDDDETNYDEGSEVDAAGTDTDGMTQSEIEALVNGDDEEDDTTVVNDGSESTTDSAVYDHVTCIFIISDGETGEETSRSDAVMIKLQ